MRSKECDVITKCFMTLRIWQLSAHFSAVYRDSARLRSPEVRNTLVCHGEIDELSIVCCYGVASDALLHRRWAPSDSLDTRRRDGAYTREYQAPEQRHKPFYEMKNIRRHFSRRLIQCGVQMIYAKPCSARTGGSRTQSLRTVRTIHYVAVAIARDWPWHSFFFVFVSSVLSPCLLVCKF